MGELLRSHRVLSREFCVRLACFFSVDIQFFTHMDMDMTHKKPHLQLHNPYTLGDRADRVTLFNGKMLCNKITTPEWIKKNCPNENMLSCCIYAESVMRVFEFI